MNRIFDYSEHLGEYKGSDLGLYIQEDGTVSFAIAYSDGEGDYRSGEIKINGEWLPVWAWCVHRPECKETIFRAIAHRII